MTPEDAAEKAIAYLNRVLDADKATVESIINFRIPCNETLANDPHFISGGFVGCPTAGPLGMLNGLLIALGASPVAASITDDGGIEEFLLYERP